MKKIIFILIILIIIIFLFNPVKNIILKGLYPMKYQEYVEKYSGEYGVDPLFVYSVIKAESNFDKNVVSKQNAKGLMQIVEETAQEISAKIGVEFEKDNTLFIPEENIAIGTKYLSELIKYYNRRLYFSCSCI